MEKLNVSEKTYYTLSALLALSVLVFDLSLPLGIAGGVPYAALVLLSYLSKKQRDIIIAAIVGSVLTWVGFYLSRPEGVMWMVLVNRFLAIFVIWIAALSVWVYKAQEIKLRRSRDELAAVNKELEAFAYSVSHDLRAPLRSIDGFSQALVEDYYDKFDDSGKNFLNRIRAACQKMGVLIDELLTLSRVTRHVLELETVDLTKRAREIEKDLREREPERNVEFIIQDGVTAQGDIHLLDILMSNLLGNAWKYTGKHDNAKIEFGSFQDDGNVVYFVRDNGAGFNMEYYDKLFGAFQRLHLQTEFEGVGVGLATVQRVISRHGGHIWAEGKEGEGATFYFSL